MIHENEIIMLLLGIGIFLFSLLNKPRFERIPESRILLTAYHVLLAAWVFTILEEFFLKGTLNFLEHFFYAVSAVLTALWCWKITLKKE